MEDMELEEGISIWEIFRVIFNRKWLLLIITVSITILGILAITLVVNKSKKVYTATFTLDYPGVSDNRYPDGTVFSYKEIITLDILESIKQSDESFASIDVEKMFDKNDIIISQVMKSLNNTDTVTVEYIITAKAKYFDSNITAKKFISKIANKPIEKVINDVNSMDFSSNLANFNHAFAYNTQIDCLLSQKKLITDGYASLIAAYGQSFVVEGRALRDYLADVNIYFENNKINTLYTELETNGYVKDKDNYRDTVNLEINELTIEKEDNEKTIKKLKEQLKELVEIYGGTTSSIQTYESFNERIANLTVRNVEIERKLLVLNGYLASIDSNANEDEKELFEQKLDKYYNDLQGFTTKFADVTKATYVDNSKVIFNSNSVILASGDINLIIACIGSLILGFAVACGVILIMDLPKYLKEKKVSQAKE